MFEQRERDECYYKAKITTKEGSVEPGYPDHIVELGWHDEDGYTMYDVLNVGCNPDDAAALAYAWRSSAWARHALRVALEATPC